MEIQKKKGKKIERQETGRINRKNREKESEISILRDERSIDEERRDERIGDTRETCNLFASSIVYCHNLSLLYIYHM